MAHVAKLGSLTEELITVLTGLSSKHEPQKFNTHRESVLRSFRHNSFPRTNQFDVQTQLDGIVEKCHVYNKDGLGDALRLRLDELQARSTKWTPEILQLLLELSDKPGIKSKLEDLDFLKEPGIPLERHYTWEELAAEDPLLRDKHVWRNIDYGVDSSDDEVLSQDSTNDSRLMEDTTFSSVNDEELRQPKDFIVPTNTRILSSIQRDQFWRPGEESKMTALGGTWIDPTVYPVTNLQITREVLFMLLGLPTSLFQQAVYNQADLTDKFGLKNASIDVFRGFIDEFRNYGDDIMKLRRWSQSKQEVPLIQSVQETTQTRLRRLDHAISELQGVLVAPNQDTIVSIVKVRRDLQPLLHPILKLSRIIADLEAEPYSHAFRCLELFYDETCISHMAGDDESYKFMGEIFFDSFQVYLRPIRTWMERGELAKNDRVFFVSESTGDIELASIWQDRYLLRKTSNGMLHAPKFLQSLAARRIFNTGKSIVILRHLGKYDLLKNSSTYVEPKLGFDDVCSPSALVAFPELFAVAFDKWIQSKHHAVSSTLQNCLFGDCGLRTSLKALGNIYFMQDGAATGVLANAIFDKLNTGNNWWNDRFTVTELAHSTMGILSGVTAELLRVSFAGKKYDNVQRARKTVKSLASFTFTYKLPWSVQIVITNDNIAYYQKILVFLLQIRRSAYMLARTRQLRDTEASNSGTDERSLFYLVRSRLLWFTSTLYDHITGVAIEVGTLKMHKALLDAEDIDHMIHVHASYIKNVADEALLSTKLEPIHNAIISILDLSLKLSDAREANAAAQASYRSSIMSTPKPHARTRKTRTEAESSDEDRSYSEDEISTVNAGTTDLSYIDKLRMIKGQFDKLHKFVGRGLRSVARAGDQGSWEMLAEKLELSMNSSF